MKLFYLLFLFVAVISASTPIRAQRVQSPDGEIIVAINAFNGTTQNRLISTKTTLYCSQYDANAVWSAAIKLYETAPGVQIIDFDMKNSEEGDIRSIAILLNNGQVTIISYNAQTKSRAIINSLPAPPATSSGFGAVQWQKIIFPDNIFVRASSSVFSCAPTGSTWTKENTGLGALNIQDITIDAQNSVLGATNKGLYQLASNGSGWSRVTSFDTLSVSYIFPLKNGSYYLSVQQRGLYFAGSLAGGWQRDTAGIGAASLSRLILLSDGTLAGVGGGGQSSSNLWKKESGAASWGRFDNSLTAAAGAIMRVNDIAGSQTIEIATNYGCFSSLNKGAQWVYSNSGVMAEEIYGYVTGTAYSFASTGAGIFRKKHGEQNWEKIYPAAGFISGRPLFHATNPESITTQLAATIVGQSIRNGAVIGSFDNGATWTTDTVGLSKVPYGSATLFNADNQGNKFIGVSGNNGTPVRIYSSSGSWAIDTAGMDMANIAGTQMCLSICSDFSVSNTYISGGIMNAQNAITDIFLLKKSRPFGAWEPDSNGLNKSILTAMTSSESDQIFGGSALVDGVARIFRRDTNGWKQIPSPPTAVSDVQSIHTDKDGSIYVAFSPVLSSGAPNRGVYSTSDMGKTWEYAGLDSLISRGLTATADGIVCFTNRGIYKLAKQVLKNPKITLSLKQINFGDVEVGKTKDTVVEIGNTGNDTLRITNFSSTLKDFSAKPGVINIAPGAAKQILVSFTPTTAGDKYATIRTVSNTFPDSINLSGKAVASNSVKMTVNIDFLHFDTVAVGQSKDLYFIVKSEGGDTLRVISITASNSAFTINPSSFNLASGDTQSVRVRFRPTSEGDRMGAITILTNANTDTLRFDGTGKLPSSAFEENSGKIQITITPNPVSGQAACGIKLNMEQRVTAHITDALGCDIIPIFDGILSAGEHSIPININLASGIYFMRILSRDGSGSLRFVKIP